MPAMMAGACRRQGWWQREPLLGIKTEGLCLLVLPLVVVTVRKAEWVVAVKGAGRCLGRGSLPLCHVALYRWDFVA